MPASAGDGFDAGAKLPGLTAQKVDEDRLMVSCGKDHPWATKGTLSPDEHLTVLSSLTLRDARQSGYLVLLPVHGLNLERASWAVRAPQARDLPDADTFIDQLRNHPPAAGL